MDLEASNISPLESVLSANASPIFFYLASYTSLLHPLLFYRDDSFDTLDLIFRWFEKPCCQGPPLCVQFLCRVIALYHIKSPLSTWAEP